MTNVTQRQATQQALRQAAAVVAAHAPARPSFAWESQPERPEHRMPSHLDLHNGGIRKQR